MAHDAILTVGLVPDDSQITRTLRHLQTHTNRAIGHAVNAHTQPLGKITGEANEFQKSLAASNARVIAFGASTGILYAIKSAFQQLLSATIEVEKEMTEINSIFRLSGTELKTFSNNLFALASNYGLAFSDASKAAVEFARQGSNVVETLKRTSAALALSRISSLGVEESVSALTSVLNTFQKEGLEAMDVINRMAAVDQNFAISAGAMADALSRVSSSASDANVSLNETMGLIAAAKQITGRTGSVIGNSFKTMFTRLQRPQVLDDLESVGVKARDAEGRLRPMMDVLRDLSSAYDGLAASQKSFVAETVGGVYQINILKAIMRDLGSGVSIVDGAMKVAGESTDLVNSRMEVLNETIASQLIRTANNLKLAFFNIGNSLVSGPMRTGLSNFDSLVRNVGKYTDPVTAKGGETVSGTDKFKANASQGFLKGIANFAAGPGLQFLMNTLLKLFERLEKFTVDAAKELSGVNDKEKQRQALNQGIAEWMGTQRQLLIDILNGHASINDAAQLYLTSMKDAVATASSLKSVTEAIGVQTIPQVSFINQNPRAAEGYIPNLEISEARRGGYQAGRVLNTTINDGINRINITANSAENITRVIDEGKAYDFVNPPVGSPAANVHRQEAIRQTGIDPYNLPKTSIKARGFIPNLVISPEMVRTIMGLGVDPKIVLEKARLTRMENFTDLPEDLVATFVSRYRHDSNSLMAALVSLTKKGPNIPLNSGPGMAKFLSGFMLNPLAKDKGLFPDMSPAAIASLTESLTGKEAESPQAALAKTAKLINLRPEDVQRVLDLHSKNIPFIAGYESPHDLSQAQDRPEHTSSLEFPLTPDASQMQIFKIKTPIYGFKSNIAAQFAKIEAMMMQEAESDEPFTPAEIGATRGIFFDKKLRAMAKKEGVRTGDVGSSLDIYGPVKSILSKTNIKGPVDAMELKASAYGAEDSGSMAEKLFRTFAGEPGSKERKPVLKGPVSYVPKLSNIQQFDSRMGGIGIIDADKYGEEGVSDAAYASLIYAATASGKPIRIHYGPMTMGKTTAAEHIANKAGGLGSKGGDYITDIKQINEERFKQFIINKTDRKNLDTGVFGLALSAASQVRAFYSPFTEYKAKREEMIKRLQERNRGQEGRNAEAIAKTYNESAWLEYETNIAHLQKKLGPERVSMYDPNNPMAAKGFVPNLALNQENINPLSTQDIFNKVVNKTPHPRFVTSLLSKDKRAQKLFRNGWEFIGEGMESVAFRKKGIVFKYMKEEDDNSHPSEINNIIQKKSQVSLAANQLFSNMGLPVKAVRTRKGRIYDMVGTLQRFAGEPLRQVLPPKLSLEFMRYIDKKYENAYPDNLTIKNGPLMGKKLTDDVHDENFTALNPKKLLETINNLSQKGLENSINANNEQIMSQLFEIGKIKAIDLSAYASGFIPNLYKPINDALVREDMATNGNAKLSSHPLLKTLDNPMGLAAIDGRHQKNAEDAVNQHMFFGQSLSSIRKANSAKGYIPNLALENSPYDDPFSNSQQSSFSSLGMLNSLMLSLVGTAKKEVTGPRRFLDKTLSEDNWLSSFASSGARAAAKLRLLEEEFTRAKESLIQEKSVGLSKEAGGHILYGGRIGELELLQNIARDTLAPIREVAEKYQKNQNAITERNFKTGLRTSTIASIGGGVASQFAQTINPSLGEAVDEFTSGATQAGQILLTFPSKFGWAGALAIAGGSMVSAIDIWRRGMGNAVRSFELSHARIERVNSQLDTLAAAINKYDSMITDASVSLQAIEAAQREYRETLAELRNTPDTRATAERIDAAPDTRTRLGLLIEEKQKNIKQDNLAQAILAIKKYADARSFIGAKVYGLNQLGYSNLTEKHQVESIVRSGAGAVIARMSSGLKDIVSSSTSTDDLTKKLFDAQNNPNTEIQSSAKELVLALQELAEKLDTSSLNQYKQAIVNQLQTEKNDTSPQRSVALAALRYRNAERQTQTESALNYARLQQRIFVNSGALNASNQLNIKDIKNQSVLDRATIVGAQQQADTGVYRLQYGERTIRTYETATELGRIGAERTSKVNQVNIDTARTIFDTLTQNFDQKINNAEQYKNSGKPGGSTPTIGTYDVKFIDALNKGITKTVETDLSNFVKANGSLDVDKIIKSISSNSGADNNTREGILNYLKANAGNEIILKSVLDANKQIVSLNQEANTEAQKQTIALQGFYREANFKEMAGYLGGIRSLMDRGSRRNIQRNLVKGAYLMENGRNSEARATGASLYLDVLKSMGKPLDPNKNTALSRSIKQAYEVLIPNLAEVQKNMVSRVNKSRLLGGGIAGQGLQELASQAGIGTATAATLTEYPIEGGKLLKQSTLDINSNSNTFNNNLSLSSIALENFAVSVEESRNKMVSSLTRAQNVRAANAAAAQDDFNQTVGGINGSGKIAMPSTNAGEDKLFAKFGKNSGNIINSTIIGGAALLIGRAFYKAAKSSYVNSNNQKSQIPIPNNDFQYRVPAYPLETTQSSSITKPSFFTRLKNVPANISKYFVRTEPLQLNETGNIIPQPQNPPTSAPMNAAQKRAAYKQQQGLKKHARNLARQSKLSRAGKAGLVSGLVLLGASALNSEVQASDSYDEDSRTDENEKLFDINRANFSKKDIQSTSINAAANAIIMKNANMKKLGALKRGAALAGVGLVADKLEDTLGGGAIGQTASGALNIGGAMKFFGTKGGIGAGIGIGSEFLRQNVTEKRFGYGAGATQGFLGSAGASAVFGPVGAAVGGGLYLAGEAAQINAETKSALSDRSRLDSSSIFKNASDINGTTENNVGESAMKLLSRLLGRENELRNRKEVDEKDFSGFYGNMMKPFAKRQFGQSESKELAKITSQKARLTEGLSSGDSKQMIKILQDIQIELAKQARDVASDESDKGNVTNQAQINSQIKVDISVKDLEKIPSDLNDSIISPLIKQLSELQIKVNELINQSNPQPASI